MKHPNLLTWFDAMGIGRLKSESLAAAAIVIGSSSVAWAAAPVTLDDRQTVVEWQAPPRWAGNRPHQDQVETAARVRVALDTQRLAGRPVRIYLRLAPSPSMLSVSWKAPPGWLPGRLQPGGRALVFQGIPPAQLRAALEVLVSAPGVDVRERTPLRFSFEAETDR